MLGALVVLVITVGVLGNASGDREEASAGPSVEQEESEQEANSVEQAEAQRADEEAERQAEAARQAEADAAQAEEERLAEERRLAEEAAAAEAAAAETERVGSVSQQNAYRSAVSYLNYTAFSRAGLIDQLEFEGYDVEDAEFAIARLEAEDGVDWDAQAAAKAADYLEFTSFSRTGLIDQLIFEGFTPEQAEYGVGTTGL